MSTNDCQSVQPQLSTYHDGELPAAQSEWIVKHVESCSACLAELKAIESLGSVFEQLPVPQKPADLWRRIERDLPGDVKSTTWTQKFPYGAGLVSLAASILILLGAGLWYGEGSGEQEMGHGGAIAIHSHEGNEGMSAEHMTEFANVMNEYLRKLPDDPDAAERMLLSRYSGETVDSEGAVKLVGYRPIVSGGLPAGYSLASTSVLKMPCCTCVKAVCQRNDGSTLVLFEHDDEQAAWFGDRPSSMAICGDEDCCLVDLDSSIAATWKQGSRSVTAVGVRDQNEVATLVNWLGNHVEG